jgi:hypothetical protein
LYCLQIIKLLVDAGNDIKAHLPLWTRVVLCCTAPQLYRHNCTALQLYCLQIMKMLIDAGANIEATLQPGEHPDRPVSFAATPLAVAAMYGKLEAMQVLLGEWQQFGNGCGAAAVVLLGSWQAGSHANAAG